MNMLPRFGPRKIPDAVRPPRVFDAGNSRAGYNKAVDEVFIAPAHFYVADGDIISCFFPDLRGSIACATMAASAVGSWRIASFAVICLVNVDAGRDDVPEDITRPWLRWFGACSDGAAENEHETEDDR